MEGRRMSFHSSLVLLLLKLCIRAHASSSSNQQTNNAIVPHDTKVTNLRQLQEDTQTPPPTTLGVTIAGSVFYDDIVGTDTQCVGQYKQYNSVQQTISIIRLRGHSLVQVQLL